MIEKADELSQPAVPHGPAAGAAQDPGIYVAPQWKLVWWKFRKHRMALIGGAVVLLIYAVGTAAEFLAPFPSDRTNFRYLYAPPQTLHFFDPRGRLAPHVEGYVSKVDPMALRRTFVVDPGVTIPIGFFVPGAPYRLFGLLPANRHLIGPRDPTQPMYLLGGDRLGRDVLSRLIAGARISMSVGLVGVCLSLTLGIILGGLSGYYGGAMDSMIQRTIEFVRSIPSIPLWLGLAAALPLSWPPLRVYFAITIILSLIGWTSLARVVRGRFLSLREEDFVTAARLDGAGEWRIIFRHMLPAFTSHIIASVTLAIPAMILSETALSFLGLGLREPVVSWGVMLQDAQDIRAIATAPWLLAPALAVAAAVLSLNFLGDGLRDAADPYSR
jgi:peptide/nickel transport system permease protein